MSDVQAFDGCESAASVGIARTQAIGAVKAFSLIEDAVAINIPCEA